MARIRKGDEVVVIAGKDKGMRGKVLSVDAQKSRLVVEGVNTVKRHSKPTTANPQGGIVTKAAPIHRSNVMLWSEEHGAPGRTGSKFVGDGGDHYDTPQEARATFGENAPSRIERIRVVKPSKRGL